MESLITSNTQVVGDSLNEVSSTTAEAIAFAVACILSEQKIIIVLFLACSMMPLRLKNYLP